MQSYKSVVAHSVDKYDVSERRKLIKEFKDLRTEYMASEIIYNQLVKDFVSMDSISDKTKNIEDRKMIKIRMKETVAQHMEWKQKLEQFNKRMLVAKEDKKLMKLMRKYKDI